MQGGYGPVQRKKESSTGPADDFACIEDGFSLGPTTRLDHEFGLTHTGWPKPSPRGPLGLAVHRQLPPPNHPGPLPWPGA